MSSADSGRDAARVFASKRDASGAGDGPDRGVLGQEPGQGDLARCRAPRAGEGPDVVEEGLVGVAVAFAA
jgi:hypothetical protein